MASFADMLDKLPSINGYFAAVIIVLGILLAVAKFLFPYAKRWGWFRCYQTASRRQGQDNLPTDQPRRSRDHHQAYIHLYILNSTQPRPATAATG